MPSNTAKMSLCENKKNSKKKTKKQKKKNKKKNRFREIRADNTCAAAAKSSAASPADSETAADEPRATAGVEAIEEACVAEAGFERNFRAADEAGLGAGARS